MAIVLQSTNRRGYIGKPPGVGYWWGSGMCSRNMTIPRQLTLGEGNGQKKGKAQSKPRPVSLGRPRREVDVELLKELQRRGREGVAQSVEG